MPKKEQKIKRVTRADVAREAGVSETIVSYVVNNNRYVSKEKRKRVEEVIAKLNYRPNNVARALKGKPSNQLIFIADQITNEYFSRIVSEMDKYAYKKGYLISLCANRNTDEFVSQVISRQYDGIIISSTSFPEKYVQRFVDSNIPVILFMNRMYHNIPKGVGTIDSGLYSGARDCVKHLISLGRKNIIYLDRMSSRRAKSTMDDLRLRGYVHEMEANGLKVTEDMIITGCKNEDELEKQIIKKMKSGMEIDGIFGRNDMLACIALNTLRTLNIKVPSDISIIGFDNSSISKLCNPSLTTMEMQREEISKTTIEMLHSMINGEKENLEASFSTDLIKRETT